MPFVTNVMPSVPNCCTRRKLVTPGPQAGTAGAPQVKGYFQQYGEVDVDIKANPRLLGCKWCVNLRFLRIITLQTVAFAIFEKKIETFLDYTKSSPRSEDVLSEAAH